MTRTVGAVEFVQSLLPSLVVDAFAVLTQLGDVWLLASVAALFYWSRSDDRDAGVLLVGLLLGALALTVALKAAFALPRPPAAVHAGHAEGFGFPSGHAIGATVLWGGLALLSDAWTRRRRLAAAAGVIALVSFSRVAIGVHYAVDVIAGVAVGAAFLGGALALGRDEPRRLLWAGTGVGAVALVLTGGSVEGAGVLGATLGAALAWTAFESGLDRTAVSVPAAVASLPVIGGAWYGTHALAPAAALAVGASAAVAAGLLALPVATDRVA